jgi:MFS family permease
MNEQGKGTNRQHRMSQAMAFILLFSIVSLFSDMTHEGASSIRGAYLDLMGASAAAIGFISGLGELIGYSMRYLFGRLTDKTKQYWPMVILGYTLDVLAVPALALCGEHGWVMACGLLVVQRMGKAMKKPAKDTIMSFAASQEGAGKSFAIQEMLDQIGAFLGPVFLFLVMRGRTDQTTYQAYRSAFAWLAIPGGLTMLFLLWTRAKFPNPENFEPQAKTEGKFVMRKDFVYYIIGICLFAFGFIDYSLISVHIEKVFLGQASWLTADSLPLVYSLAMLVDAVSAFVFGLIYDRIGLKTLIISTLCSAPFALLAFQDSSVAGLILGVCLWGIGMGAQESILKAAVTTMVPAECRATGYGAFEFAFGIAWFLGSWLLGALYDVSVPAMMAVSLAAQLAAIPFYRLAMKPENRVPLKQS